MIDGSPSGAPALLRVISREAEEAGIFYGSDARTGALLRTLAASKPGGSLLELGTGIGLGAAWLLDGMDERARLTTVDIQEAGGIARRCLGRDPRVTLVLEDAAVFLEALGPRTFDLIFADAPFGKFFDLDRALGALAPGGLYVADDMIPDPADPERAGLLARFSAALAARDDLAVTGVPWGGGIVVASRRA